MIKLLIKGDRNAAYRAAARARVTIDNPIPSRDWDECVAWAPYCDREMVVLWFCESAAEAPFPYGTLLWFSERSDEE